MGLNQFYQPSWRVPSPSDQGEQVGRVGLAGQGLNGAVEGDQDGSAANRQAEEQRIRNLALTVQPGREGPNEFKPGVLDGQVFAVGKGTDLMQQQDRVVYCEIAYGWVGH